jgi:hypothetical protein
MRDRGVGSTPDLERVLALPRRAWDYENMNDLCQQVSELYRLPEGQQTLWPVQTAGLCDALEYGLFGDIDVGGGKTLISFLLPTVLEAQRSILLLPGGLLRKTEYEFGVLRGHWVETPARLVSYQTLGRTQASLLLEDISPDLIVCDEVHLLKNKDAAVTRRVARWMEEHPETKFVGMSGTVTTRSLLEFAHLVQWALGRLNAPVPADHKVLEHWARALDAQVQQRVHFGVLEQLVTEEEIDLHSVRRGFSKRLHDTPGVVGMARADVRASIVSHQIQYDLPAECSKALTTLLQTGELPNGDIAEDPVDVWTHSRELLCGCYGVWDPPAPEDWLEARREYHKFVRDILARKLADYDSPLQVANACRVGRLPGGLWSKWKEIESSFTPNTVTTWVSQEPLIKISRVQSVGPTIFWVDRVEVGLKLAEVGKMRYYGAQGLTKQGESIMEASENDSIVASINANSTGHNLQKWSRNCIVNLPQDAGRWQQLIGRTHRPGQLEDEVLLYICYGHSIVSEQLRKAISSAQYTQAMTGVQQKLLLSGVARFI